MADVFISYAREDKESAKRLADAIESRGWTVWWDRRIPAGKSYEDVIQQAIDDAGCVIVLWTGKSVASEWVRNEAAEAARRKVLIPIRLEDVRLPLSFRHLQADDLLDWTSAELENCLDSIQSMIGARAKRAAEPSAISVAVKAAPLSSKDESASVPPSAPPPTALPATTSGFKRRVSIGVAIAVGLLVLIIIALSSKKQLNVNTDTASVDTSATETSATPATETSATPATETSATPATETMATSAVTMFTSTSTSATTTGAVAVASEVVDLETSLGKITIELFPGVAPNHVNSFLRIARSGGFDGASVYYVATYFFAAGIASKEQMQQELNDVAFVKGTVMGITVPSGGDDRSGIFYVAVSDVLDLDRKKNTVFGRVIAGIDVADKIAKMPADAEKRPLTSIIITRAVVRKRDG
jgi:cyclophilin family peptidyl-prolyl cis-trans isomerase